MAKIDVFGILALLGSVVAAALFGGIFYTAARGSPILDIVALIVVFLAVGGLLYLFFFRYDRGRSQDVVWMTIGFIAGLIAYPVIYVASAGLTDLSTAEIVVTAMLIILGIAGVALLMKIRRGLRSMY